MAQKGENPPLSPPLSKGEIGGLRKKTIEEIKKGYKRLKMAKGQYMAERATRKVEEG